MAQYTNVFYKNVLAWRGCEKLYLDKRTCDVYFVFKTENDEIEKVPAHKSILSAISEVFDAMFFGPSKQDGDINIVDTTVGAFKEFLQYFYLSTVKLTAENVAEVMNLGKQYMLNDCLDACTEFCKETLTLDNMCWGYELAILFEQDDLKQFCEQKISANPQEIFRSNSFLICDKNLLRRILQLDTLNCEESVVFDGCLAWAKAACIQKGLDEEKIENLRAALGDLFGEIRFGRMTVESLYARHKSYEGLFTPQEFIDIIGKITSKESQPRNLNHIESSTGDILICDRKNRLEEYGLNPTANITQFRSNCALLLTSFICHVRLSVLPIVMNFRISEHFSEGYVGNLLHFGQITFNYSGETVVELPKLITIRNGVRYAIEIEVPNGSCYTYKFKSEVRMNQGAIINFLNDRGIVKCLHFVECKKSFEIDSNQMIN